jgi:antitoxin ParD1/3/4
MTKLSITLRDEHQHLIQQALKSGRFVSESEVVAEALNEFQAREELRRIRREHLKKEVLRGVEELDKKETVEFTAADIQRLGRERLAQ